MKDSFEYSIIMITPKSNRLRHDKSFKRYIQTLMFENRYAD